MEQMKYCVYIDVLGYKNIIKDDEKTTDEKISILKSIYENIAGSIKSAIKDIHEHTKDEIFFRAFSDCLYLHCDKLEPLIYATNVIFKGTFNKYSNFSQNEEYTPFIRAGIAKGWVINFNDIGAIINNTNELNPVGLGVVNAYETSEKSNLSGMRIILSTEVFNDLQPVCEQTPYIYKKEIAIFQNNIPDSYYFKQINEDRCGNPTHLYELIWSYQGLRNCTYGHVKTIKGIASFIPVAAKKHLKATSQVLLDGLLLTDCNALAQDDFSNAKEQLERLINE
jgi:hypothetical protein